MVALTLRELNKRDNIEIFIKKIINKESFELIDEKKLLFNSDIILIEKNNNLLECLQDYSDYRKESCLSNFYINKQIILKTSDGIEITSGFLKKTNEFGSVALTETYNKETLLISSLVAQIDLLTNDTKNPINLEFYNHENELVLKSKNIVSIKESSKQKGVYVKSDFEFLDDKGNSVLWISHKDGNKPNSFRQWSGIKEFENHKEIKSFEKSLKTEFRNLVKKQNVGKKIKSLELKKQAIFGTDIVFGPNYVNAVIQGDICFENINKNTYKIKSNYIFVPEMNLKDLPQNYEPIIFATKLNLEPNRCSFGIQGCRGLIYPIKGKKVKLI